MAKQIKRTTTSSTAESVAALASLGGKMPPQVPDFEEAVLGAFMLDANSFASVVGILKPEHFYVEANRLIFEAMQSLNGKMAQIDMLSVREELRALGTFEQVGGDYYIAQLTSKVGSAVNVEYHARIIFQKYLQRKLIEVGGNMITKGYDDTKDVEELMQEAEGELFDLSNGSLRKDAIQVEPIVKEAIDQMLEAAKREDRLSGIPSGFPSIDKVTLGWQAATMVVIAARPAMGKTAFVLSMARKMAIEHNIPVAIFSLEMSNVELVKRLMVAETEIPSEVIKSGRLTSEQWTHFNNTIGRLESAPIYIDDTPGLSVFDLRSKARILKKTKDIKCVIIDYLQLMTASAMKPGNRQEEVSMISRSLKGLAKELNIPVIALSQLNRSVEQRTVGASGNAIDGKRPQLSDLRESGAIEQDADMVCFLHRPEYYHITDDGKGNSLIGMAQFIIAKHRSGKLEDVLLKFQADLIRFEEPDSLAPTFSLEPSAASQQYIMSGVNNNGSGASNVPDMSDLGSDDVPF